MRIGRSAVASGAVEGDWLAVGSAAVDGVAATTGDPDATGAAAGPHANDAAVSMTITNRAVLISPSLAPSF